MPRLTTDQIQHLSNNQSNIRNISVIGQINHGKTLLSNYLVNQAGIIVNDKTDVDRLPINKVSLDIVTTNELQLNSIYFECNAQLNNNNNNNSNNKFYINLIDTPGHSELLSKVSSALRITDGSLFVVDCIDGLSFANETILRQSSREKHKPLLFINKLDRYFNKQSSLGSSLEEIYSSFELLIDSFNVVFSATNSEFSVNPTDCNIAFGSSLLGFAFTLDDFAGLYSNKFAISKQLLLKLLWGNNYYDPVSRRFTNDPISKENGNQLQRCFCEFVLKPISQIFLAIIDGDFQKLKGITSSLKISITENEITQLKDLELAKLIFSQFLPVEKSVLSMIVNHCPSPLEAQLFRVDDLYQGPMDDNIGISISSCNVNGPLVMYISALVPKRNDKCTGEFYALGRIFSGSFKKEKEDMQEKVKVIFNSKTDKFSRGIKNKMVLNINNNDIIVDSCNAGNVVCIKGIDRYVSKSCTVSTENIIIREMIFPTKPIYGRIVETKDPKDITVLMESLKKLDKYDQIVKVDHQCTGEIVVYGSGQYHLDYLFSILKEFIQSSSDNVEINIPLSPLVAYRESINQESTIKCLAKSPNKQNRIYCTAEPLPLDLSCEIISGYFNPHNSTPKEISNKLCDEYSWKREDAKNIWAFGLDDLNTNILVDTSNQYNLQDIKDDIISAFNWVTKEGAICEENIWGVRFNIGNVYVEKDLMERGKTFITPTTRRVLYASQLSASPILLEPVYNTQINIEHSKANNLIDLIEEKRGCIITENSNEFTFNIIAQLPVVESSDFDYHLKLLSQQAYHQNIFSHWLNVGIVGENDYATDIALKIRERKGLKSVIPLYSDYCDLS